MDKKTLVVGETIGGKFAEIMHKEFDITGIKVPKGSATNLSSQLSPKLFVKGIDIIDMVAEIDKGIETLKESRKSLLAILN